MLNRRKDEEDPIQLDRLIAKLEEEMLNEDLTIEEYQKKLVQLERLTKLKPEKAQRHVSPDTLAIVAGNLVGIFLIIAYEQKHVLTSKGLGQLIKPR